MAFYPIDIRGNPLRVKVEGCFDTQRDEAEVEAQWKERPLRYCVAAIVMEDPLTDLLIARPRLELALPETKAEPRYHLQLGGLAHGHSKSDFEWLAEPRWPVGPTDFILLIELVLFNFFPDVWRELRATNPWQTWVRRSETLVLSHYRKRLNTYWDTRHGNISWLDFQANENWNPRPS